MILDSSAIVAILLREPEHEVLQSKLGDLTSHRRTLIPSCDSRIHECTSLKLARQITLIISYSANCFFNKKTGSTSRTRQTKRLDHSRQK